MADVIQCDRVQNDTRDAKKPSYSYKLMRSELAVTDEERDLGIMANNAMKVSTECCICYRKSQQLGSDNKKWY